MAQNLRKDYVLVSSDARAAGSASTTDFTVRLALPLTNVVKTDLVQCVLDYNIANVVAPNNQIIIEEGAGTITTRTFGLNPLEGENFVNISPGDLRDQLQTFLGEGYNVSIENEPPRFLITQSPATGINPVKRTITVSERLARNMGLTGTTITPVYTAPTMTWAFPPYSFQTMEDEPNTVATIPSSTISVPEGDDATVSNTITISEGLYTPYTLTTELTERLSSYLVQVSTADVLSIEYRVGETESNNPANRGLLVASAGLRNILGLTSPRLRPVFVPTDGAFGTLRWTFPRPLQLSQTAGGYMMLQSRELGNQIITSTGDVEFYRLLLNDPTNNVVSMVNNRVDTYLHAPRTIKDIDIRLLFPDKSVVNNRGGSFTLLLEVVRSI